MRLSYFFPLIAALLLSTSFVQAQQSAPLEELNARFQETYAQERTAYKDRNVPTIVSLDGKLIFLWNGKREEHELLSPAWQTLKMVDHVPLFIFVLLHRRTDAPLDASARAKLLSLKPLIAASDAELARVEFSPLALARQRQILCASSDFIDTVLADGSVSKASLLAFCRALSAATLDNAYDAEVLELGQADSAVSQLKKQLSAEQWRNLRVIVCDGHMPRQKERLMQYFLLLLGEKQEGGRVAFMENGSDEGKALDLLATHELDAQIGSNFFHDAWRMHRDLLSDGAARYLKEHPPLSSGR